MTPLPVSVVIPTYNRAELLRRTLDSVLAQRVQPLEVIVVDDGSVDDSRAVCEGYGDAVRYIWQENRGLPGARNTGIAAARGEWVALCDSDDLWHPRKLEVQHAATTAAGAEWSVTGFDFVDPDDQPVPGPALGFEHVFPIFGETGRSAEDHFGRWLSAMQVDIDGTMVPVFAGDAFAMLFSGNIALPSTALVSRALFARVGGFDEQFRCAEETEFFHRAAARSRGAIVMMALASYRIGHASIITTADTSPLMRFAMQSIDRAASLRPLSMEERAEYERGRIRLQRRLAYNRLAALDPAGARAALRAGRDLRLTPGGAALYLGSFVPPALLRNLHAMRKAYRRLRARA